MIAAGQLGKRISGRLRGYFPPLASPALVRPNLSEIQTTKIATVTPQPTSPTRDISICPGVAPTCGTSKMMVAVTPASRAALEILRSQEAMTDSITANA